MFVVFDLETTGFSEATCDIIEFAYVEFDENLQFVKSEQLYFYYKGMSWSEEAYKVHQIPLSFLEKHEDKFRENIIKMYTVLNHANVVGHNALRFDCPFAKTWLLRQGIRNLEYGVIQDTMIAFQPIYHGKRISLVKLAQICGITPDGVNYMLPIWFPNAKPSRSHEAAFDVVETALITLQGLSKNLIRFEPLLLDDMTMESSDISSMYEESHTLVDPDRFILELVDDEEKVSYHFMNHDYQQYIDLVPTDVDIERYELTNKLFPVQLSMVDFNSYVAEVGEVKYTLHIDKNSCDTFTMTTPYGSFNDLDLNITNVIKNNFNKAEEVSADV